MNINRHLYDNIPKINNEVSYNRIQSYIEDLDVIIDGHTPSVYEYSKYCVENDDEFLNWLFNVDYDIHTYNISEEDEELLNEFLDYCK